MGYFVDLRPTVVLVDSWHRDNRKLWRSEIEVNGRMVDATAWANSPAEASADGRHLRDQWGQLRRWVSDTEGAA